MNQTHPPLPLVDPAPAPAATAPKRIMLLGATGTIGQATLRALLGRGHQVVCVVRRPAGPAGEARLSALAGAEIRFAEVTDPVSLRDQGFGPDRFDALVSCLASRTGVPADAWAIDHKAHAEALALAGRAGVGHVVLLSAICVQKPQLAFQHAKLAFETMLVGSGITYSIVRPTAYFKSLSGQIARVRAGKPFLVFGNGHLTACKPISDEDLGDYLAGCLEDEGRHNRILPIGGPGKAITPREQGEELFRLLGKPARFTQVPVGLLTVIAGGLSLLGRVFPKFADKAELARIGRYYATESMLVLDPATGRYDAGMTPSAGTMTLFDHYARVIAGQATVDLGDHAVF